MHSLQPRQLGNDSLLNMVLYPLYLIWRACSRKAIKVAAGAQHLLQLGRSPSKSQGDTSCVELSMRVHQKPTAARTAIVVAIVVSPATVRVCTKAPTELNATVSESVEHQIAGPPQDELL